MTLTDERKTLDEWAEYYEVIILDPDGFDRSDPALSSRLFTREEFLEGLPRCTISASARVWDALFNGKGMRQ